MKVGDTVYMVANAVIYEYLLGEKNKCAMIIKRAADSI